MIGKYLLGAVLASALAVSATGRQGRSVGYPGSGALQDGPSSNGM